MIERGSRMRSVRALALASVLACALCAPTTAFAAPNEASGTGTATASDTPTSTITGTIHATTLKVTVPTTVAFDIDPGAATGVTASGQKRGQYTSPTNYTVKNYSAVDVYGYVSAVAVDGVTLVNATGNLKKTAGAVGASNVSAMVGLSDKDGDMSLTTAANWLMADTSKYYAFNKSTHGKLAASNNAPTAEGGTATMYIYGAVKNGGWVENNSFAVKPTFKITVTDPN